MSLSVSSENLYFQSYQSEMNTKTQEEWQWWGQCCRYLGCMRSNLRGKRLFISMWLRQIRTGDWTHCWQYPQYLGYKRMFVPGQTSLDDKERWHLWIILHQMGFVTAQIPFFVCFFHFSFFHCLCFAQSQFLWAFVPKRRSKLQYETWRRWIRNECWQQVGGGFLCHFQGDFYFTVTLILCLPRKIISVTQ